MGPIRVLVVDDSVVVRQLVTTALSSDVAIDVVGTASTGRRALDKIAQLSPDLVTLDIEMPDMDGLETLRRLRERHPRLPVVMFSSLTERGAAATLDALTLGADDYVTKPSGARTPDEALEGVRTQLIPKIKALCPIRVDAPLPQRVAPVKPIAVRARPPLDRTAPVDVVVVGASTGGPDALSLLIAALPASFPLPVLVVQHMPPLFTRLFAQRLDNSTPLSVHEARDGEPVEAGHVYIAPGDFHLAVRRAGPGVRVVTSKEGPENWVRPAVDVLFRSAADVYADRTCAVVLTGMGQDGIRGCERLRTTGAYIAVQDEATSVVWGMPGAVANAGLADTVLPLSAIAPALGQMASRGRLREVGASVTARARS